MWSAIPVALLCMRGPERADFRLERADFRPERAYFRPERARGDRWTDGWKDK